MEGGNNNIDEDILQQYRRDFGKIGCIEIPFNITLNEDELKLFQKQRISGCSKSGILTLAIIVFILNGAGVYFAISRNEGYKALKMALESNITSISQNFPGEADSLKLIETLKNLEINKNNDNDNYNYNNYNSYNYNNYNYSKYSKYETKPCSYQDFHDNKCSYSQYTNYCNTTFFHQRKCSYMDSLIFNGSANLIIVQKKIIRQEIVLNYNEMIMNNIFFTKK